jgi:uncharacterized protein (TIGR00730 family)
LIKTICAFCGSSDRVHPEYLAIAAQMGEAIVRRGMRLVYGAGKTGLMGALADGVLGNGGEVIGIMPRLFAQPQLAHTGLTHYEVVESMHQRKERMFELAEAFIALPGGFGTFEELFEVLTWAQVGLHHKPVGLLNIKSYYQPLLEMVNHARQEGMIYAEHQALFVWEDTPDKLLDCLEEFESPENLSRWITRD